MMIISVARRLSLNGAWSHQLCQTHLLRSLSSSSFLGNGAFNQGTNKSESPEESEQRVFGENPGSNSDIDAFFERLNRQRRARDRSMMDDLDESFDSISDGMDGNLKNVATYFEFDSEEVEQEEYAFRYDATFWPGSTYDIKDLDLTKPGVRKPKPREDFHVTTKEVLSQADFMNLRFLANFLTEAGIIIKRSQTGISAKAQSKVAKEIKTARVFGLMPFTTMGTKPFVFGKNMKNVDEDFAYQSYDRNIRAEPDMEEDEI